MSRRQLFTSLFLILPILYYLSIPISVGDLAIWIAQGRYFLEHGQLMRHDVFSILPTGELVYPAGISVLYALFDRLGGLAAVSLLHKACLLAYLWIIYFFALHRNANPWSPRNLAIVGVSFFGSASICIDRPAEIAILPFIAAYLILDRNRPLRAGERASLVALTVLWVNIHGSWILLPAMFAWRAVIGILLQSGAIRRLRDELITGGVIALASLLNPFSYRIYPYILETALVSRARGIDEWAVTWITPYFPQGLFFFALAAAAAVLAARRFRHGREELLDSPFFPLILLGFSAIRNTIWPFLALVPFARRAGLLSVIRNPETAPRSRLLNAAIAGACLSIAILMLPWLKPRIAPWLPAEKRAVFDSSAPFGAAEALRSSPDRGPIFNDWGYGSFLAYAQENPIFIDTRNTIYDDRDFREYIAIANAAPGWESLLDRRGIRFVLLNRRIRDRLIGEIRERGKEWGTIWEDEDSVLFGRR